MSSIMNFHQDLEQEDIIFRTIKPMDRSWEKLEPGYYACINKGYAHDPLPVLNVIKQKDELIDFSSGIFKQVANAVDKFYSKEVIDAYAELKVMHKMGLILYGPQGTGKTCTIHLLMLKFIKDYKAICLDFTASKSVSFVVSTVTKLREIQNNPIVAFVDEFESVAHSNDLLTYLDGNSSVASTIFVGCTNFIKDVPERIKNRKSRIKYVFEVVGLPPEVYKQYIEGKLPKLDVKIKAEFCYKAEEAKLSIDQFKNAIINFYVDKQTIDESIASVKDVDYSTVPEEELEEEDDDNN